MLAPTLFNVYTNDQPQFDNCRRFIYADDLCVATQSKSFETIEISLTDALFKLTTYYKESSLKANPDKTQVGCFHLNNRLANRILKTNWKGKTLEHISFPVYLGVTLDRTLSYKEHVNKLRKKVIPRTNLLRKLASTKWGTDAKTLKQTALAVCYSTAEYCAPVWARSNHAYKIDFELNKACRIITGTLKPTPVPAIYNLASIAPPHIRRNTAASYEKLKQLNDPGHPLFGHQAPKQRLKSRNSFARVEAPSAESISSHRLETWKNGEQPHNIKSIPSPSEDLPRGSSLQRNLWVALNRARTKVGRTGDNKKKWGYADNSKCQCGAAVQTMQHLMQCPSGPTCTDEDLRDATDAARTWLTWWCDKI